MSNPATTPATGHQPAGSGKKEVFSIPHWWRVATIVAIVMVLLALVGVGLTTTSPGAAKAYWISLVPIYGLLCISAAWVRAKQRGESIRSAIVRQVFHWLGIGVALGLDFYVRGTGTETGEATGLNALLVLALGCYLAGIHFERLFTVVGVLLTLTLLCVAKAEQYLWLIFVGGAVAIAAILLLERLLTGKHARQAPAVPAGS